MSKELFFSTLASVLLLSNPAVAQEARNNLIYVGAGSAIGESVSGVKAQTPFVIGYLRTSEVKSVVWGLDLAKEGVKLDSTWGQYNAVKQATSVNLLIGTKLAGRGDLRLDVAALVGLRDTTSSCPRSYLGYQCYADAAPNTSYTVNYGGVVTLSVHAVFVGARVTGESAQGLLGVRF